MKNKGLVALSVLAMFSVTMVCAENKMEESYNYKRGVELLLEEEDLDRGLEYLQKEVAEHKDNGYAYLWIGRTYDRQEKYGLALEAMNKAVKYLKKDPEKLAKAYYHRATVFSELEETDKMLADLESVIRLDPEWSGPYSMRANYYYEQKEYELSDNDYRKIEEIEPANVDSYMGLGRNQYARGNYKEAAERYDQAIRLYPDNNSLYSYRAEARMKLKQYNESMDDVIRLFGESYFSDKASEVYLSLCAACPSVVVAKIKARALKDPSEPLWVMLTGMTYLKSNNPKEACVQFEKAIGMSKNPLFGAYLSDSYKNMGNLSKALYWINWTIEQDSTDVDYLSNRVILEDEMGKTEDAFKHVNELISLHPDHYYGYYRRGWMNDKNHLDIDGAVADYTTSIAFYPECAYIYLARGQVYRQQGKMDLAKQDFEQCLAYDSLCNAGSSAMFASFYLGDTCRALALKDTLLLRDRIENCYDVACLYSLMDSTDLSLSYLRECLEGGRSIFYHARRDQDLEPVRSLPAFEALLQEYEAKRQEEQQEDRDGDSVYASESVEIPFTREGGVCKVKCQINGLPLHFVFDTGASDVSISSVEASFMLKNKYLEHKDLSGKTYYMTASGDISEGTNVLLHEVNFGGLLLSDIKASVVRNQKAPLLLGQTVLQRLGKIEIDYERKVLKITRKLKK